MKKTNMNFLPALILIPSLFIYVLHFLLFKDSTYIIKDFVSQLAFIPIFYFFSTIIIDNLLAKKENSKMRIKLNMLIGAFFSEVGNAFIKKAPEIDLKFDIFSKELIVSSEWSQKDFTRAKNFVNDFDFNITFQKDNLIRMKDFLVLKRAFLVSMLENQNLLEHETFTDLILAMFHLCEELEYRENFDNLPENDCNHLAMDMIRAYRLLIYEWLNYMQHIQAEYPYLFSLAVRTNPFLKETNVIIE